MLHNNIIKLVTFIWCVLTVVSCTNEDWGEGYDGPTVPEGLPVTLKLDIGTPDVPVVETKALDNGKTFGSINDLAVLVFDENGQKGEVSYFGTWSEQTSTSVEFKTKTGKRKIYVLTNVGSAEKAKYATESDLLSTKIASGEPSGEEQMLGYAASSFDKSIELYEAGQAMAPINIEGDISLKAKVVPPYSKITFKVTKDLPDDKHVYLAIKEVNVRNYPGKYSFLPTTWSIDDVETATPISLYADPSAQPEDEVGDLAGGKSFYMYENRQGENNISNGNPALKTPAGLEAPVAGDGKIDYQKWFAKWAAVPCTYIEVKGSYTIFTTDGKANHVGDGTINYRFFLGENTTSDFNIKRNTHYNVTLAFTGLAGKDELKYEWRVQADLEHSTFYPKGTLVIDGAPATIGIVPFYVVNNSGNAVTMTTDGTPTTDMKVFYQTDYEDYWTNASTAEVKVNNNTYSRMGIASNYIGILGSQGHTTRDGENNEYKNQTTGAVVQSEAANYDLRNDVAEGLIYRKRDFQLSVGNDIEIQEYPLLYLGNSNSGIGADGNSAYYARRIDGASFSVGESYKNQWSTITGKISTKNEALKLCNDQFEQVNINNISPVGGTAFIISLLPTQADIKNIIRYERKFKLKDAAYWTRDAGLVSGTTGEPMTSSDGGYVRCVYKSKGLLK